MSESEGEQQLARDLGFLEAYTIGLGTMIGAGIFVLPSIAAEQAGPASMISFAAGGLVSLLAALSLSELATGMPRAGGSYYYVNRALGSLFGSIVGWGMWAGLMFASAFYMLGFGQYLTFFLALDATGVAIAALIMAALLTAVNYYGVKETGALQNVIVLALVGLILVFLTFGVFSVDSLGAFNPQGWGAVAATIGTIYVTFIGFEVIATSAEEIKNPSRNLPLSMIAAVVTPTFMYVGVMYVSTGSLPTAELVASRIPVADVASEFLGSLGALAMVIGAVLATVSSANASILSAARVNFAMGRDRILTNWLNDVHDRFRTPYRAIVTTGAVILVLIAIGVGIGTLAEVASFMYLVTYALVHVAVVVMRRAAPADYDPSFRIPHGLYPVVPIVGCLSCLAILVQMTPLVQLIGGAIVLLGIGWYLVYARDRAVKPGLLGEALAPKAIAADGQGTATYRVVVPVANPATEARLLRLAAAIAAARDEPSEIIAVNVIEVPQQTSLEQDLAFEEERVERQRELLGHAREMSVDLDVRVRTEAIVGRTASDAVLTVVEERDADQVVLGWGGGRSTRDHVLGSTIDPIVERAPCETTLVKLGQRDGIGETVALVGEGPNAPTAARRAAEFVASEPDASLTLLNVQRAVDPEDIGSNEPDEKPIEDGKRARGPEARAQEMIEAVARDAGLDDDDYESTVVVADDIETAIIERVEAYDTICVGGTRSGAVSQALFGSLPETIGEQATGTVAMVRGPDTSPMSIREAVVSRLTR